MNTEQTQFFAVQRQMKATGSRQDLRQALPSGPDRQECSAHPAFQLVVPQRFAYCMALIVALLPAAGLHARQEPAESARKHRQQEQRPERSLRQNENAYREPGAGMQWFQEMRESDPALFEKVQTMRQQDPAAFAQWMREQIQERRRAAILDRHPALRELMDNLPENEREALEADLFRKPHPERRQRERAQGATAGQRRMREKQEIEQFDARTRHFEAEIERAEKRVQRLRELLEKRNEMRDSLSGE